MNPYGMTDKKINELHELLAEARFVLYKHLPFFGHIVTSVPYAFAPVGTACCTNQGMERGGLGRIYFDPAFLDGMDRSEAATAWIHEIEHLAFGYFSRIPHGDPDRKNRAHDHVINLNIDEFMAMENKRVGRSGKPVLAWPKGISVLKDGTFKGKTFEEVYRLLEKDDAQAAQKQQQSREKGGDPGSSEQGAPDQDGSDAAQSQGGQPSSGKGGADAQGSPNGGKKGQGGSSPDANGSGSGSGSGENGGYELPTGGRNGGKGISDATDCIQYDLGGSEMEQRDAMDRVEQRWRNLIAEAVQIHKMRGAGTLPGGLETLIDSVLKPRVSWIDRYMHLVEGHLPGGRATYQRPSRKSQAAGIFLPGRSRRKPRICIVKDVSGSTRDQWEAFLGVTRQLVDTCDTEVRLIQCDTRVTVDEEVEDMETLMRRPMAFSGGGGTVFDLIPERLENEGEPVNLVVLLTDGEPVRWPPIEAWPCPVVVVTTRTMPPESYHQVVKLDLEELGLRG
jgi:predicted metal-dependent peptidase